MRILIRNAPDLISVEMLDELAREIAGRQVVDEWSWILDRTHGRHAEFTGMLADLHRRLEDAYAWYHVSTRVHLETRFCMLT